MAAESHAEALHEYRHSNGNSQTTQTTQTEALDEMQTEEHHHHNKHHSDFLQAYEHMPVGYGEDRNEKADKEIHTEGNPNVHEHVCLRLCAHFIQLTPETDEH